MKPKVEILAPAGSWESMAAAINAGADAVYMGGSRFGARAYADNPQEEDFLRAIDYVHLHGKKLYMTVNTLVKEEEIGQAADFLLPYYRQGLDAAIVQDLGVFSLIRDCFPKLPIHASTQMTVTGYRFAKLLKELGAARIVTARELSLEEIAEIRDHADIEIESFVHGALCYCYSGQCLLSSLIGGRSGNRGRCAQPCRLPYEANKAKGSRGPRQNRYLMNLKDLCTLDLLPDILEAGVYSLKIEGRMKSPRYTAGVVHIYRKYVDQYLERGRAGYRVDPEDKRFLLELFDRGGFTDGYYRKHNGRDMIALGEKPAFREVDPGLLADLDQEYVKKKRQEPVSGRLTVREGEPVCLELESTGGKETAAVSGAVVQTAQNQPMTKERLFKQMNKTGDSPFSFTDLQVDLAGDCFLPVQELNELRRQGLRKLEQKILEQYRRDGERLPEDRPGNQPEDGTFAGNAALRLHVSLEEREGLAEAASHPDVDEIYLDACGFPAESWRDAVTACRRAGKACGLILPHIFRRKAEQYFKKHIRELKEAGFDELVLRSLEEPEFLKEQGLEIPMVFDANLYGMNGRACTQLRRMGASRLTLPLELNERELQRLTKAQAGKGAGRDWELMAYGHIPAMVSAQCIRRTTGECSRQPEVIFIKDRTGKRLPVKNHCRFCYNTIYNPDPLSLLGLKRQVEKLGVRALRLSFTVEEPGQIREVLDAYGDHFRRGKDAAAPPAGFTRGHFKRGVE